MNVEDMTHLVRKKDKFGNDVWFGDTGPIRLLANPDIEDYSTQLDQIRNVELRQDDVIVVGFPKSGNNWTHHMTSMLVDGTTELAPFNGRKNFIVLDSFSSAWSLPPPDKARVFLSHLPWQYLPRDVTEKRSKLVHVRRNPKDVLVSLYCHVSRLRPPRGYDATWPQFFEVMLEEGLWYGDIFEYLKGWEKSIEANADHPIYISNFEDSKRDTLCQVERLNEFLGTNRSRELCQAIASTCQMGNMAETRKLNADTVKNRFLWKDDAPKNAFYRKGMVGDWKNWFTVAQNELFDEVYKVKMAGYKGTFTYDL